MTTQHSKFGSAVAFARKHRTDAWTVAVLFVWFLGHQPAVAQEPWLEEWAGSSDVRAFAIDPGASDESSAIAVEDAQGTVFCVRAPVRGTACVRVAGVTLGAGRAGRVGLRRRLAMAFPVGVSDVLVFDGSSNVVRAARGDTPPPSYVAEVGTELWSRAPWPGSVAEDRALREGTRCDAPCPRGRVIALEGTSEPLPDWSRHLARSPRQRVFVAARDANRVVLVVEHDEVSRVIVKQGALWRDCLISGRVIEARFADTLLAGAVALLTLHVNGPLTTARLTLVAESVGELSALARLDVGHSARDARPSVRVRAPSRRGVRARSAERVAALPRARRPAVSSVARGTASTEESHCGPARQTI